MGGDFFDAIAKVELHLHLEGAIPHRALWRLVDKYGGDPEVPSLDALIERFQYRDFSHFIDTWVWKNQFLRAYEDFELIATEVARDLARQNIIYAEAFYSPLDFRRHGLEVGGLTEALRRGLDAVPEVEVALVVDLIRDFGPERGMRTLDEVTEVRDAGNVIGIGIGGSEQAYPPEPFAPVYAEAARRGFRTTAHAGEAAGAASVWGVIESLGVDRIGHGVRAIEDPALVDVLRARKIPLEMCPTSNVCTAVTPTLSHHPIRRLDEHGVVVTVNTDDPSMFNTTLAGEYRALVEELGFERDDVRRLIHQAVDASWASDDRKAELAARVGPA